MGKSLSEVERAYLAGLIDGDGAVMAVIEKHSEKKFGYRIRVEIKVTQTYRKDVSWIFQQIGIGYLRKNGRTHEWIVRDQRAALRLCEMLAPYTRAKRNQIHYARRILNHSVTHLKDLKLLARWADTLSAFNVRSRLRRKNYATKIRENGSPND